MSGASIPATSVNPATSAIPAKAGIQGARRRKREAPDSRRRGNDGMKGAVA